MATVTAPSHNVLLFGSVAAMGYVGYTLFDLQAKQRVPIRSTSASTRHGSTSYAPDPYLAGRPGSTGDGGSSHITTSAVYAAGGTVAPVSEPASAPRAHATVLDAGAASTSEGSSSIMEQISEHPDETAEFATNAGVLGFAAAKVGMGAAGNVLWAGREIGEGFTYAGRGMNDLAGETQLTRASATILDNTESVAGRIRDAGYSTRGWIMQNTQQDVPESDGSVLGTLTSVGVGMNNAEGAVAAGVAGAVVDGAANLTQLGGSAIGATTSVVGMATTPPTQVVGNIMSADDCSGYVGDCTMSEDLKQMVLHTSQGNYLAAAVDVPKAAADSVVGAWRSIFTIFG